MTFKVGDRVFDPKDERHIGVIRRLNHTNWGTFAVIRWEDTGWLSMPYAVESLQHAEPEVPSPNEVEQLKERLAK